jgi:hypothetical protein
VSGIGQLPTVLFGLGAIGLAREPRGFIYELESRIRGRRTSAVPPTLRPATTAAPSSASLEGVRR